MSEFSVRVVRIPRFGKHPNADTLSITQIRGENVIFKTGEFQPGDLAVYVPADAVVPNTVPGTEFLDKYKRRVRPARLRGIYSEGVLLPVSVLGPPGIPGTITHADGTIQHAAWASFAENEDVAERLGITKHEEVIPPHLAGEAARDPGFIPVYDVESYKAHKSLMQPDERVVVTEKIHGTNARFAYLSHRRAIAVGSRNMFWKEAPAPLTGFKGWLKAMWLGLRGKPLPGKRRDNVYWATVKKYALDEKLKTFPDYVFYGEIFGQVQDLKYDAAPGQTWFRVFDVYNIATRQWLNWDRVVELSQALGLETVPVLYDGPFDAAKLESLVEGKSELASHFREGVVVKPAVTRVDSRHGRVILKWVSETYKLRKNGTEMH